MQIATNHPQRIELNDEVHARPAEPVAAPARFSYLGLTADAAGRDRLWRTFAGLAGQAPADPAGPMPTHISVEHPGFRVRLERHSEFIRLMVIVAGDGDFDSPAIDLLPPEWRAAIDGDVIVAVHAVLRPAPDQIDLGRIAHAHFGGNVLVGADIGEGAGSALTDFRIHGDGFARILVFDRTMTSRQAGRMIQRLMEVETYRMMALLAFPVARALAPDLAAHEADLAAITTEMAALGSAIDEPALLDRLSGLEARIDSIEAASHYRFSASAAYFALVQRRIDELRERRIAGLQTFEEFIGRRVAPAMATVSGVEARLRTMSERVSRATQLIATRVALTQERQNQALLETMNDRAAMQLRLQQTVEGISVAAISYYVIGLIAYAAKAAKAAGVHLDPDIVIGLAIPVVIAITALGLRRLHETVAPH